MSHLQRRPDFVACVFKPAFHDTDTDILATILAMMSASASWNADFIVRDKISVRVETATNHPNRRGFWIGFFPSAMFPCRLWRLFPTLGEIVARQIRATKSCTCDTGLSTAGFHIIVSHQSSHNDARINVEQVLIALSFQRTLKTNMQTIITVVSADMFISFYCIYDNWY